MISKRDQILIIDLIRLELCGPIFISLLQHTVLQHFMPQAVFLEQQKGLIGWELIPTKVVAGILPCCLPYLNHCRF